MSIVNFDDFKPKSAIVLVGDKQLQVSEYTIAQRDAVMSVVFDDVNIIESLKPIFDSAKEDGDEEGSVNAVHIAEVLKKVLGGGFTKISLLTLNTDTNRKLVEVKTKSEMDDWINDNLRMRQEVEIIKAVLDVNDFVETIKKYLALVNNASQ